eukprot:gnl/TRDRNA2_/TRDRNA2_87051_c0_seq1.p1 gnl/TRDRNA2_/TRDRNA2_87051_c0~~gnl/TRDRNA2_/TRDRNA2_87051_c0_seq1.p1  ORF type:complete len:222 (+),score=43.90 gnl/TRDRNA2_/TRDRNA2_87051_c0_seq1:127-792(+)
MAGAGCIAAAGGGRSAGLARYLRERPPPPSKASEARFRRCKELAETRASISEAYREAFKEYDKDKSGTLKVEEICAFLTDNNLSTPAGTPPSDEELQYILKVSGADANSCILFAGFIDLVTQWGVYVEQRQRLEEDIKRFDTNGTGKLERTELREYLKSLNDGVDVTDEEVEWVMSEADRISDGSCSKQELVLAAAAWYAYVGDLKAQKKCNRFSQLCSIM